MAKRSAQVRSVTSRTETDLRGPAGLSEEYTGLAKLIAGNTEGVVLVRLASFEELILQGVALDDCIIASELDGAGTLADVCRKLSVSSVEASRSAVRLCATGLVRLVSA